VLSKLWNTLNALSSKKPLKYTLYLSAIIVFFALILVPPIIGIVIKAPAMQTFLNLEMTRYTLVTGEPITIGFMRLKPGKMFWGLFFTVIGALSAYSSIVISPMLVEKTMTGFCLAPASDSAAWSSWR